ncbi:hypothetical protein AY599_09570 [Leptolyngbya valderiana BDU 20041]|nr:hypothetical protein AY599_09570 [Leptolyngbya valderiana BDU 20041]
MFKCHVCGSTEATQKEVQEVFQIDGKFVLVEHIPALVCDRCGEKLFSSETTERVRQILYGESKPVKSMQVDVFAYPS